jgi:hypothetical protein
VILAIFPLLPIRILEFPVLEVDLDDQRLFRFYTAVKLEYFQGLECCKCGATSVSSSLRSIGMTSQLLIFLFTDGVMLWPFFSS